MHSRVLAPISREGVEDVEQSGSVASLSRANQENPCKVARERMNPNSEQGLITSLPPSHLWM
jgi:hypothetical protein